MRIFLEMNESEAKRRVKTIKFWKSLGCDLYSLAQTSDNIDENIKERLVLEFCLQYAREQMEPFLATFKYGEIEINYSEINAINVANVAAYYSEEEYKVVIDKTKESLKKVNLEYKTLLDDLGQTNHNNDNDKNL